MKPLQWMRRVRDDPVMPTFTRAVAWSLGLRADQSGHCFPSYERIAQDCGMSRRAARLHVDDLVSRGWLLVANRMGSRGWQSNSYQLIAPVDNRAPSAGDALGVVQEVHSLVQEMHHVGSAGDAPRRRREKEGSHTESDAAVDNPTPQPHLTNVVDLIAKGMRLP